jgi:hypothetical protein
VKGQAHAAFEKSFRRADEVIRTRRRDGYKGAVHATFVGQLVTQTLSGRTFRDGTVWRFGFGHGSEFPARLVLNFIRDVMVMKE